MNISCLGGVRHEKLMRPQTDMQKLCVTTDGH